MFDEGPGLIVVLTIVTCNEKEHKAQGWSVDPRMVDGVVFLQLGNGGWEMGEAGEGTTISSLTLQRKRSNTDKKVPKIKKP